MEGTTEVEAWKVTGAAAGNIRWLFSLLHESHLKSL
jgi:hypothetical protein